MKIYMNKSMKLQGIYCMNKNEKENVEPKLIRYQFFFLNIFLFFTSECEIKLTLIYVYTS